KERLAMHPVPNTETTLISVSGDAGRIGMLARGRSWLYWLTGHWLLLAGCQTLPAAAPFRYAEAKYGKGELRYINDLPVLFVEGTPEEIGAQMAVLGLAPAERV